MKNWSIDILRQGGWDLWLAVCVAASVVLLSYAVAARVWSRRRGLVVLPLIAAAVMGTGLIVTMPQLRTAYVGVVWTFLVLTLLSVVFYLNLRGQLGTRRMGMLLGLRILALALLVPMLFEPVIRYVSRPRPERPLLLLIDTSGSMSFPDVPNGPTRLQSVWQTIRPRLATMQDHFIPRFFTFSTGLNELEKPDELARISPDGQATDIAGAVRNLLGTETRPHAAVILISDGIDNASPDVVGAIRGAGRAVNTLWVGSEQAAPASLANVAVDNIEAADDFIVDHESKIKVTIKSSALANRLIDVKMAPVDESGKTIGEVVSEKLVLQPLPQGQTVELGFKPRMLGVQRLAVWVAPIPGERSIVDNRQEFQGLALDPRIKVIYVEGRARPEFRDLNRALGRDANIEVASLLRIQQDRFAASGAVEGEPFKQMPVTGSEWRKFDVIILGDLDASFLSRPAQAAIEQAVSDGAGLLMIGGTSSFGPGGYKDTPIEKALPVLVGDLNAAQEKTEFVPRLTPEGLIHPAMQGLAGWFDSPGGAAAATTAMAQRVPPLRGNVVVKSAKSGAQVLMVHPQRPGPDGAPQVVLAVQLYGKGRSAAFTADTTYLWYTPLRGMGQDSPYNRFWGQLIRWLAGEDVRNRQRGAGIEGLLNKSVFQLGESVHVRALVRDEKGDATRYATVSLTMSKTNDKASPRQLPLNPSSSRTGMYDVTIPAPEQGDYRIELSATKDGKPIGKQSLKFSVIAPADEMLKLAANPQLLKEVATASGGFHYPLAQLPTLVDQLIRTDPAATEARQQTIPLHNTIRTLLAITGHPPGWARKFDLPMQALLVVGLLACEWILRRRWQLP